MSTSTHSFPFPTTTGRRSVSEGSSSVAALRRHHQRDLNQIGGAEDNSSAPAIDRPPPPPPPLDPLVVKESYVLGEALPGGETETIEFKSGTERKAAAVVPKDAISADDDTDDAAAAAAAAAVRIVRAKVVRYVVAFLNSSGGAILFGVEDDGAVSGCLLTEKARVEITKAVDVAVEGIDPQVDVGTVRHRFAPVVEEGRFSTDGAEVDVSTISPTSREPKAQRFVVLVTVRPESSRLQPAYYPTSYSLESYLRRAESVYALTPTLVVQREDEFRAVGRTVHRTWRHVARNGVNFDGHIDSLRSSSSTTSGVAAGTVPRMKLLARVASAALDAELSPRSRIVAVVGPSGTGKSTLVASLVGGGRNKCKETIGDNGWKILAVCGWYFCGSGAEEDSASGFVGHIAASLTVSHHTKAFRRFVQDNAIDVLKTIEASDPRTAFRGLLRLCRSITDQPGRRLAICVDAIDEAAASYIQATTKEGGGGRSSPSTSSDLITIPDLIFSYASEAPPWLVFVVTSRSTTNVPPGVTIVPSDEGAAHDIAALIAMRREEEPRLEAALTEEAAHHLAEAAGSNFQFVHSVLELVEGHGWGSSELSLLLPAAPTASSSEIDGGSEGEDIDETCDGQGLDDAKLRKLYSSLFRLQFPSRTKLQEARCVLELLLAARRPLVGSDIVTALSPDVPDERVRSALAELMAYLTPDSNHDQITMPLWVGVEEGFAASVKMDATPVRLQHLSFRQWLLDPRNTVVSCNSSRGHARLAMWHLGQAHSLSTTLFIHERFPLSDSSGTLGSIPPRGTTALREQEAIYHVLEAAIQLGQMSTSSDADSGIVGALRDLSGKSLFTVDNAGRSAVYFATRQGNKAEYLVALNLLLSASASRCPSLPIEAGLHGKCPLVTAAQRGYTEAFALLVQTVDEAVQARSIEPDDAEEAMEAALWAAASSGAVGCVELLVGNGLDLSTVLERGMLMSPTEAANRHKPCPIADPRRRTALWLAVAAGNAEVVSALVAHPPRETAPSGVNYMDIGAFESDCCKVPASPLHIAVSQGNTEIVRLLAGCATSCLVGQVKGERWPTLPLCSACILGNSACVEEILYFPDCPDSVNLTSAFPPHRTALHEAVWNVRLECVRLLLNEPRTDALLADDDGAAALHEACYWGKGRVVSSAATQAEATEILKILLSHHQEKELTLDLPDTDGCTPLCFAAAAEGDQAEWVELLLDAGASPHVRPWGAKAFGTKEAKANDSRFTAQPWGGTPLEEAATRAHANVVTTLCAAAAGCMHTGEPITAYAEQARVIVNAQANQESNNEPLFERSFLMEVGGDALADAFGNPASAVSGSPRSALQKLETPQTVDSLIPDGTEEAAVNLTSG